MMVSPMRRAHDEKEYKTLGKSYKKTFINRPSFNIGKKKVEFDFSPKPWMLKAMRHARFLRTILPEWHKNERAISLGVKEKVVKGGLNYSELKALENIKGYRDVRYESAKNQISY
jgi:indolepyruvate ferredoxin oxidoreductase